MHKRRLNGVEQIFEVQTCSTCISIGCHDNSLGTLNFRLVDAHFRLVEFSAKQRKIEGGEEHCLVLFI